MKRLFIVLLFSLGTSSFAQDPVPRITAYMGYLTDAVGDVVADEDHSITFRLYKQASWGSAVVTTTDGLFSVVLGVVASLDDVSFDRACHLGISIGGGRELSPRVALVASPCSLHAKSVEDGSVTAASIAEGPWARKLS